MTVGNALPIANPPMMCAEIIAVQKKRTVVVIMIAVLKMRNVSITIIAANRIATGRNAALMVAETNVGNAMTMRLAKMAIAFKEIARENANLVTKIPKIAAIAMREGKREIVIIVAAGVHGVVARMKAIVPLVTKIPKIAASAMREGEPGRAVVQLATGVHGVIAWMKAIVPVERQITKIAAIAGIKPGRAVIQLATGVHGVVARVKALVPVERQITKIAAIAMRERKPGRAVIQLATGVHGVVARMKAIVPVERQITEIVGNAGHSHGIAVIQPAIGVVGIRAKGQDPRNAHHQRSVNPMGVV